ncbi:MAG: hypothetical protein LBJ00_18660 [Planctomycetaceae bacterium]|nr:hypothetical protein [Planctomycetaceae bacterium]
MERFRDAGSIPAVSNFRQDDASSFSASWVFFFLPLEVKDSDSFSFLTAEGRLR